MIRDGAGIPRNVAGYGAGGIDTRLQLARLGTGSTHPVLDAGSFIAV
ncbi:MAG: hypothetical protein ACKVOL_05145 [Novosphingobium sp.]